MEPWNLYCMTNGILVNLLKKDVLGWRDSTAGKTLATKPSDLNWIPGIHMVQEKTNSHMLPSDLHKSCCGTYMYAHTINNCFSELGEF